MHPTPHKFAKPQDSANDSAWRRRPTWAMGALVVAWQQVLGLRRRRVPVAPHGAEHEILLPDGGHQILDPAHGAEPAAGG